MAIKNHPLGHITITSGTLAEMVEHVGQMISDEKRGHCIPLNLTKYVVSKEDEKLASAINASEFVIADGVPIRWLSRRSRANGVRRITGIDLAEALLRQSRQRNWPCFFFGASPENQQRAIENSRILFNDPIIAGHRDGYFDDEQVPEIIDRINSSGAKILFLGLGMPQKEYFVRDYMSQLNVSFCLTVGGAFDIWAGVKQRTPKAVQSLGLEWAYRSFYDINKTKVILAHGMSFAADLLFAPAAQRVR